ncbi:hypothetical protein N801_19040 [Knoellia aerolata DSM 18566]|uniref:Uncharacterized protein n=1 Tax=Knoellia aerolata DSM 18566 TaxID=1385519 RepID=A0A0A0JSV2_9MICO|nr:hypothetical protein [Knoellia aerolata]KGN39774.1 hypothetical protein N801_19040 [Knoellia aerolata DSM 18566]
MATFYARYEKALRTTASATVVDGRLQGAMPVLLADLDDELDTRSASVAFELLGPGDIERLGVAAISRRFPTPGANDAEETKLALVEFHALDLPWRYTPQTPSGAVLRPWIVLVVGRRGPDEITVRPDGKVTLGPLTQASHPLGQSGLWAHVHEVGTGTIARLVSPVDLASGTEYVACLVPAFDRAGGDAWHGAGQVTVDCYDRWSFATGPQGDFADLAARLHKADLATIEAAGGRPFGRAEVRYRRRLPANPEEHVLQAAGALRLPPGPGPAPVDASPPAEVTSEVTALQERILTPDGRPVLSSPRYPEPFVDPDTPPPPDGWMSQLSGDPRVRGAAGIGAWAGIEWQDRISDAAAAKAGDLAIARDRIGHLALGLEASRSLWRRRVPSAPVGAGPDEERAAGLARLAVLSPCLGRLPTDTHEPVLDRVTGHTPWLNRAVLSSAARRALRPGPARLALAEPGAGRPSAVLEAANTCPPDPDDPTVIGWPDAADEEVQRALEDAVWAAAGDDTDLAEQVLARFAGGRRPSAAEVAAALAALVPGRDGRPDPEVVQQFLETGEFPTVDTDVLHSLPNSIAERAPAAPCRTIDLGGLALAVSGAVDPTVDRPIVVDRVLATLPGFTHIGPVEIEPELDLPLWSFVSERSPDWMLPGAGDLPEHAVVGLSTNPGFVQALLAGANHQTTSELRWRNVPLVSRWSPLRKFWQRAGGEMDIAPIRSWPAAAALGTAPLADEGRGEEAVVAFRTPLFRRYPATVVYLFPDAGGWDPPAAGMAMLPPQRIDPTFVGTIGEDITFFGFPVPPTSLRDHWVVLEEPPAGYRFYHRDAVPPPWPGLPEEHSAAFAYNRFALPVRVLIGPLL